MIDEHIDLVKRQLRFYETQLLRFPPDSPSFKPNQIAMYRDLAERHRRLLAYLEAPASSADEPALPDDFNGSSSSPDLEALPAVRRIDADDLPPELVQQLSSRATRGTDDPVVQVINEHGGVANLDDILIGLYRRTREIHKRNILSNRLYRLAKQGLVAIVPHKKGLYTTKVQENV